VTGGCEWLVDAVGCPAARLTDVAGLLRLSASIIERLELCVLGEPLVHQFPEPGGVTALYLLTESHLAWHTYPESGLMTLNVYCCRPRAPLDWAALLGSTLGADRVSVRRIVRGDEAHGAEVRDE
jgi:S-adenosylmethionine decarboxylase